MSDIDDLSAYEMGTKRTTLKKHLQRGLATVSTRGRETARLFQFLNDGRREPSLPHFPCLDKPIINYLEE